ncbi:MAG: hypothetical protein J6V25_04040 [Oscillospiraceae bacterium]|nr:hypothetical protein [Oscillospiraceae bacterium]
MKNVNWNDVQDDIRNPVPGGYAAKITRVEDNEEKEYLKIEWEFADGEFKGVNKEVYDAFGFWPLAFVCSYKEKALRFFKGFKTAVENSNPRYVFNNDPQSLVGKFVGVVLGEEEYLSKKGEVRKRLYVAEKRSGKAIRDGEYEIPALKRLPSSAAAAPSYGAAANDFAPITDDDAELPF